MRLCTTLVDGELLKKLEGLGSKLQIVLSNAMQVDAKTKKKFDENDPARKQLKKTAGVKWDRMMPDNHIGHNKFLVYVGKNGPEAVLFGSTNWTSTGLCAQTNNIVIIDDAKLAKRHLDYWTELATDTKSANGVAKSLQGPVLRKWDTVGKGFSVDGSTSLES